MPETNLLTIGVVGAGEIVSRIHLPVLSACQDIRLAYVADVNPHTAASVAKSFGTSAITANSNLEALPQSDVVLLAVPVHARMPYYELFARRGTRVLAEKPLAANPRDAERVCGLFPDFGLACGFQRRSYATANLARRIVTENWFGALKAVSIAEGAPTTKTGTDSRFYDQPGSSGGVLMDLGCHSLDLAIYITGASEAKVVRENFVFDGEVDREIDAQMVLSTSQGECDLDYFVTWLRPAANVIRLQFEHCVASLSCRPAEHIEIYGLQDDRRPALLSAEKYGATTVYQAFYLEWTHFLEGVRQRQPCKFAARTALPTIAAVDALYAGGKQSE